MGVFITWFRRDGDAMHFVMKDERGSGNFLNYMFRMFVLRRYRAEVWQRIAPAIPASGEPSWTQLRDAFADMFAKGEKIFPGQFRPTTLRSFRPLDEGPERSTTGMKREERELWTLKLLYQSMPEREIERFTRAACPSTFAAMYDKLKENLRPKVSGVFGDYGIKLMLDMLVVQGSVPDRVLSRWPTDCPGYRSALATLFPGLPSADHLTALYWVHRQLSEKGTFLFPESCAQLCWDQRRQAGILVDAVLD